MAYLAEHRGDLKVPALGCVEIRRDTEGQPTPLGEGLYFQCGPCGDELVEEEARSLFECGTCGYTMTGEEAQGLASDYVRALSSVFTIQKEEKEKRGIKWLLATLFGSRKKRRALTS
jgi:predicted RNA-binding Zn-ribbon protein involved in translation (DUF1610 family)